MGRKPRINLNITKLEADGLIAHLAGLIGKGSMSTTPSWARSLVTRIKRAQGGGFVVCRQCHFKWNAAAMAESDPTICFVCEERNNDPEAKHDADCLCNICIGYNLT